MTKTSKEIQKFSDKLIHERKSIPPISLFGEDVGSIMRVLLIANNALAQSIADAPEIGNSDYGSRVFIMYGNWLKGSVTDEQFIKLITNN